MTLTAIESNLHGNNRLKLFLLLAAVEGLPLVPLFLWAPSENNNVAFAGRSVGRLALVAAIFAIDALLWAALARGLKRPDWLERVQAGLDRLLVGDGLLVPLALSAAIVLLAELALLYGMFSGSLYNFLSGNNHFAVYIPVGMAVVTRSLPLQAWAGAVLIQAVVWLALQYRRQLADRAAWSPQAVLTTLFVWAAAAATLAVWGILVFKLRTLIDIAGYYWGVTYRPIDPRDIVFLALALVLAGGCWWALRQPSATARPAWKPLLLVYLVGYGLVLGVGFVSGQGIESLRQRYVTTLHRQYAELASETHAGVADTIRNYDALYANSMFTRTKPPGVMAAYIALERVVDAVAPQPSAQARFLLLTQVIAWLFPLAGLLAVALIAFYVYRVVGPPEAVAASLIAPALFVVAPNIVLLNLFLDQALYPALFLIGTLLVIWSIRRRSLVLGALAGAYLYLTTFMTFSMLPLLAFAGLYGAIDIWLERSFWGTARTWAGMLAGILALFAIFAVAFGYTFWPRFQMATLVVHNYDFYLRVGLDPAHPVTGIAGRIQQIAQADWLNNIEFAVAVGLPVFALFLLRAVKVIIAFIRRQATRADAVQAAFLGSFIALDFTGSMRGEAARLWMFWVPMVAIFAGIEIAPLARKRPLALALLLLAQVVTLVLTFHFQDLHVI